MTTSTLTKLQVANNVLNSVGERSLTSIGGVLGSTLESCLRESVFLVCNNTWNELRSVIQADSWVADAATLPSSVYRVRNIYWYTSPDGLPSTTYDYQDLTIRYIDLEQYRVYPKIPFEDNSNRPNMWTIESKNKILVNPYPSNTLAKSKCKFEVYKLVALPTSDTGYWACSDLLLNLIQYKATELFSIKFLNDVQTAQVFMQMYEQMKRQQLLSDSSQPTRGYNMYRGKRGW